MPADLQADLQLVVARDPVLLLEQAADGFLVARRGTPDMPFPSPPYLLALRQGGLRDDLIARAARRGIPGWFDPPLCLFHELPVWLGTTPRRRCDDFERAVILGGVLRRLAGDVFGRLHRPEDFLRALDRLFGELLAEGVVPEQFRDALERRADRDGFERQRDAELALVYREYAAALDRGGLRDGRDGWLDCARAVAADPSGLAARLGGRREIRIVGLQDLRGGWRALLRALQASPALDRIVIYSAEPLDLGSEVRYRTVVCPERATAATRLFGGGTAEAFSGETRSAGRSNVATIRAVVAPDVERELEVVASRIRALVDGGIPLRRIAVVARQARPYVDLALAALAKAGVPATARRRVALAEVPAVRAVRTLVAAAAEGWSRHGLAELADQPYLASELDAHILNFAGRRRRARGLRAWQQLLDDVARDAERDEAASGDGSDESRRRSPPAARCREAATRFARFAERAGVLDRSRTLAEWVGWLETFVADDSWEIRARIVAVPSGRFAVARVDSAGWDGLVAIVARWRAALYEWGGAEDRLDAAAFGRQLADLLDGDVALWTETKRGVPVLEGLAAAYREFDHVFLVGLEAGRFPLPAPRSAVFDERERRALREAGLPLELRETWDERERELFRVLVAGAGHLTVSYARLDASGRETTRSAFVDALADAAELSGIADEEIAASAIVIDRIRLCGDAAARDAAVHAATIERERASGRVSPYNGLVTDPALVARLAQELGDERLWSPTQLESYAKCPWSYFSARFLRVARLDVPDDEMDAATRGSLLHEALHRFYRAAAERSGGPVFLRAADLAWAEPLLVAALDEALAAARGARWLGDGRLLGAKREELRRLLVRFLAWEVQDHEDMDNPRKRNAPRVVRTGVAEHEVAFHDVTLERNGIRVRFRGTIDRLEVGVDPRFDASRFIAAVDYKTTKAAVPGAGDKSAWDDGVVLQVPLYAYAMTRSRPDAALARIEYRAVQQRETAHALEFHQFDKKSGQVVRNEAAFELMARALDAVAAHVQRAREGVFPAAPAPSCGCPRFCHALEICRIAGGPRLGW